MENSASSFDINTTKSPNDKKEYRFLSLDNGLEVILICDATEDSQNTREEHESSEGTASDTDDEMSDGDCSTSEQNENEFDGEEEELEDHKEGNNGEGAQKKAAAAMAVGVGSFSDPGEVQGLAHFLEHMLFMGSEKYPTENEYDAFISKNGGCANAYTEFEHTVYFFDVVPKALEKALDIFSQFFVAPLMRPEATARELGSIESEFCLSLNSDGCRLQQLMCHQAPEGHPYHCFAWGNHASLRDAPAAAGADTRAALRAFYRRHYRAPAMRLAVLGTQSLDELEQYVRQSFSAIPESRDDPSATTSSSKFTMVSFNGAGGPFPPEARGRICRIVPAKDIHRLTLTWQLPCQFPNYRSKPAEYLGHLVGHEGAGSALALLKARGLALALSAGVGAEGFESNTAAALFSVSVHLTEQGVARWEEAAAVVHQYLSLLRREGPQEWVFRELAAVADMNYRFLEESDPDDAVVSLAVAMLPQGGLAREHLLRHEHAFDVWEPGTVAAYLAGFTPAEMRVDLMSKLFAESPEPNTGKASLRPKGTPEVEPYFSVEYWSERIPEPLLEAWATSPPDPALHLPAPNPFLPTDFSLAPPPPPPPPEAPPVAAESGQSTQMPMEEEDGCDDGPKDFPPLPSPLPKPPTLIVETSMLKAWYLQDEKFKVPRVEVYLKLATPMANASPREAALADWLVRCVRDSLEEQAYLASVAELHYSLRRQDYGLELKVSGFSHKAAVLLRLALRRALRFAEEGHLAEDRAAAQREELARAYRNADMKAGAQATNLRLQCLKENTWSAEAKGKALEEVGVAALAAYARALRPSLASAELLLHGNLAPAGARALADLAAGELGAAELPGGPYPEQRVARLPPGGDAAAARLLVAPSKDPAEKNCAVEVYWQVGQDTLRERVLLDVIEYIMDEPIYDVLRTKEQLGYAVSCSSRLTCGVTGFSVKVQSASHSPQHIYGRVVAFLDGFRTTLQELSPDAFEENIGSLARLKLQKDMSMVEESGRHWYEIQERRYLFNPTIQEAVLLKTIQKEEVIEAYERWMASSSARRLVVVVVGQAAEYAGRGTDPYVDAGEECEAQAAGLLRQEEETAAATGGAAAVRLAGPEDLHRGEEAFYPNFV